MIFTLSCVTLSPCVRFYPMDLWDEETGRTHISIQLLQLHLIIFIINIIVIVISSLPAAPPQVPASHVLNSTSRGVV